MRSLCYLLGLDPGPRQTLRPGLPGWDRSGDPRDRRGDWQPARGLTGGHLSDVTVRVGRETHPGSSPDAQCAAHLRGRRCSLS